MFWNRCRWSTLGVALSGLLLVQCSTPPAPAASRGVPPPATVANGACDAGALCVGKGQAYSTLRAALAAARAGSLIEIVADTYRETARLGVPNIVVRGVGGRPHFDCAGRRIAEDKACLLIAANGITLENLEISGAVISTEMGANGACIRNEPDRSFTVRGIVCHGSQDGMLTNGGTVTVVNSEFYDNGWTGFTHNVYFSGNCPKVTVRGSTFRDARVGHEFKSRCRVTDISDSTFRSTKGSRDLDIPDGGATTIAHSTLEKTAGAQNEELVGFAAESCKYPADMVLKDVRIVNSAPDAAIHNFDKCRGHPIVL